MKIILLLPLWLYIYLYITVNRDRKGYTINELYMYELGLNYALSIIKGNGYIDRKVMKWINKEIYNIKVLCGTQFNVISTGTVKK